MSDSPEVAEIRAKFDCLAESCHYCRDRRVLLRALDEANAINKRSSKITLQFDRDQVAYLVWLMEDTLNADVMALDQFAGMRAAKETMKQALATVEASRRTLRDEIYK